MSSVTTRAEDFSLQYVPLAEPCLHAGAVVLHLPISIGTRFYSYLCSETSAFRFLAIIDKALSNNNRTPRDLK